MKNSFKKQILNIFSWMSVCALMTAFASPVAAQPYPAKPVRLVVPFPPGGGVDVTARILAQRLSERTGQTFIVDNRAGASGIIGTEAVVKAAPDGYTMLVGSQTTHCVVPAIYKVNYSTGRDLVGVTEIAKSPMLLLVHPQLPVKNAGDLIKLARARPGQLTYGAAHGATIHMAAELLKIMAKIDILLIPYKGEGPAIVDVMGGQVMLMFSNMPVSLPQAKSGRLRVLAVTSAQRVPTLPEVPTIAESGMPGYEAATWFGMFAPAATPREIIAKLNTDAVAGLNTAEVKERMANQGYFVVASGVESFAEFINKEIPRWAKVVKTANITPQ
ncbi:MAG: tripartite tricarboxylate transporter substrate binding protein [Burkholderiales bacterium]